MAEDGRRTLTEHPPNVNRTNTERSANGLAASPLAAARAAFYGSSITRLFQGVASVVIGPDAFQGGTSTAMIGILMHFGVAMAWSILFAVFAQRFSWIRKALDSRFGTARVSALYGPFIWVVMSLAVIPALTRRPPAITARWWIQFFGHIPFVALPIVAITRDSRSSH